MANSLNKVTTKSILDATVATADIADNAVDGDKLADDITLAGTLTLPDTITHTGDTNTKIRFPAADTVSVETGGSERLRVDSSGRLLVGSDTARTSVAATGSPSLQVEGLNASTANISIIRNSANAAGPYLSFVKTRGTSDGAVTIVNNNDDLGTILFTAADGVDVNQQSAFIRCDVDGGTGSNDTPGRLTFATTADGGATPAERMRIDSSGNVGIATTSGGGKLAILSNSSTYEGLELQTPASDGTGEFHIGVHESGTSNGRSIVFKRGGSDGMDTESMRIQASGGISFHGDTAAANALDDYEEGSWVVAPTTENGSITFSGSINECAYVKIGKLVQISGRVRVDSVSSQSGWLRLSLPFTNISSGPDQSMLGQIPCITHNMNLNNVGISTFLELSNGNAFVSLIEQRDNGSWYPFNTSDLKDNDDEYIAFSGTYQTDA